MLTTFDYSTNLCLKYQLKVRGLSGKGMQISPSIDDPDRGCKVACQDKFIAHRFYLVNGEHGYFPFGTRCSFKSEENRFCVNGKCLKFGSDDTPLNGSFQNSFNLRNKRSISIRNRRHYTNFLPYYYNETVNSEYLNRLITNINLRNDGKKDIAAHHIDFNDPVFVYN